MMKTLATTTLLGAIALASPLNAANCPTEKCDSGKNIVDTAVAAGSFKTLTAALGAADLVGALKGKGPFTVFAPTDEAFAKLPEGTVATLLKPENKSKLQAILKYHVLQGKIGLSDALAAKSASTLQGDSVNITFNKGKVNVNGATLISADIKTSNGVIHVIDSVILPPEPKNDIASVAKKAGRFNTLLAAVKAAGLDKALTGKQPLTVFAPTDAAFKALPKGTIEKLLKPESRETLKNILTLHVVSGKVSAGNALSAKSAKSLSGEMLTFGIDQGLFKVNGATIVTTDIKCDNGVIHVIDAVLLPSATDSSEQASADPMQMIEAAIEKGVPVFNHGNHAKCAEIYKNTLVSLMKNSNVNKKTRNDLSMVVARASNTKCSTTRAWILRQGLDHAYAQMSN